MAQSSEQPEIITVHKEKTIDDLTYLKEKCVVYILYKDRCWIDHKQKVCHLQMLYFLQQLVQEHPK